VEMLARLFKKFSFLSTSQRGKYFDSLLQIKIFFMPRYSKGSQRKVKKVMDEMKSGKLKSGRSGKKVTNRKQAIAIGLSEARRQGSKVPPAPRKKAAKKKAAPKKVSKKKTTK
jgi:hypothetical protein